MSRKCTMCPTVYLICSPRLHLNSAVLSLVFPPLTWHRISVKLQRNRYTHLRPSRPLSASTPGWTVRPPSRDSHTICLWSLDAGPPLVSRHREAPVACTTGGRHPHRQASGQAWSDRARQRSPAPPCRRHRSPKGSPPLAHGGSLPHAACSPRVSVGGGIPARGRRVVHTSGCPQTGHRSRHSSPHPGLSPCPSNTSTASTDSCPTCCRHWASAAPWVWPYTPQHRTRTTLGGGTCCSQRPMNWASGKRIVRGVA